MEQIWKCLQHVGYFDRTSMYLTINSFPKAAQGNAYRTE